ncbi:MAG: hypothetical protein H0X45_14690, partial [Planctomycetes bacterium]|nr:hypothetical protein [Planctomycetota bacterium]
MTITAPGKGSASTTEGSESIVLVAVRVDSVSAVPLDITYAVTGSATADRDYQGLPGVVTIMPGQRFAMIPLHAYVDSLSESTETVVVQLTSTSSATFVIGAANTATIQILNNGSTTSVADGKTMTGWDLQTVRVN